MHGQRNIRFTLAKFTILEVYKVRSVYVKLDSSYKLYKIYILETDSFRHSFCTLIHKTEVTYCLLKMIYYPSNQHPNLCHRMREISKIHLSWITLCLGQNAALQNNVFCAGNSRDAEIQPFASSVCSE